MPYPIFAGPRLTSEGPTQIIPLDRLPIYAVDAYPDKFWTAQRNTTEWHLFIQELAVAGNAISKLMLQNLARELDGAHIGMCVSFTWPLLDE